MTIKMTIEELTQALNEKGYTYGEFVEPQYGYTMVTATKDEQTKTLGVKNLILTTSINLFKKNEAYTKL